MQIELPRWDKNSLITHDQLNQLAEAIEWVANLAVDGSSGLQITESGVGRVLGLTRPRVYVYAKAHGTIPARTSKLGKGLVDRYYKDDTGALQPYGGDPEDCYNLVSVEIQDGAWIGLNADEDGDWLVVLEDCGGV